MKKLIPFEELQVPCEQWSVFTRLVGQTALTFEHLAISQQSAVPTPVPIEPLTHNTPDVVPVTREEQQIAAHVLSGLVEVLDGSRPLKQVETYLSPQLCLALLGRQFRPNIVGQGYRLRTIHTQKPQEKVIEVWGRAANGQRSRAVASRMQRYRYGWQCASAAIL